MRAAVLTDVGVVEIADAELDRPRTGEMLIRTEACGLCHSDLHLIDGHLPARYPTVIGHEVVGIVEHTGEGVFGFQAGDRVVVTLSQFCGACPACDRGQEWLCDRRQSPPLVRGDDEPPRITVGGRPAGQFLNIGGFAERILVHQQAAVQISSELPAEVAALLGCGVLTGVGTIANVAAVSPGESVVVLGCGGVGLATVQGARIAGAGRIIAVDLSPEALAMAERLGATDVVSASTEDPVRSVRALTGGGADHVVEAIGLPVTMSQAVEMARPGGATYLVGIAPTGSTMTLDAFKAVWFNRTVRGVLMGANRFRRDVPRLVDLALRGMLDVEAMITARIGLGDVPAAFEAMRRGAVGRTVAMFG